MIGGISEPRRTYSNIDFLSLMDYCNIMMYKKNDQNLANYLREFNEIQQLSNDVFQAKTENEREAARNELKNRRIQARIRLKSYRQSNNYLGVP